MAFPITDLAELVKMKAAKEGKTPKQIIEELKLLIAKEVNCNGEQELEEV